MIDESRKIIVDRLAEAVAEELAPKQVGHCERVDYLSREEALHVCAQLRRATPDHVAVYVLEPEPDGDMAITADQAIEQRNRKSSVLCLLIPANTRDPAASSLGNSFKPFDVQKFLSNLTKQLRDDLPPEFASTVRSVRAQLTGRSRPSAEHEVEFLDRVSRCESVEEIGQHLWMVGLVPDLDDPERMTDRLRQNRDCVRDLAWPAQAQMSVADRVARIGVQPEKVSRGLVEALGNRPLNDVRGWLKALGEEHAGELTFEKWSFPRIEPSDLEGIELTPFIDAEGTVIKRCGLMQPEGPGTELHAPIGKKITVKWTTNPVKPRNVSRWSVSLVPDRDSYDPDEVAGIELPSMTIPASRRTAKLEVAVDEDIEVSKVQVRVAALDSRRNEIRQQISDGHEVVEAYSIPFWLSEDRSAAEDEPGPKRKSTEASLAMALFKYAMKARKTETALEAIWLAQEQEDERLVYYPVMVNNRHIYRVASTVFLDAVERHCLQHPSELGRYRAASVVDALREQDFEAIEAPDDIAENESWRLFLNARERCFQAILRQRRAHGGQDGQDERPQNAAGQPGAIITLELYDDDEHQKLRNSIQNYLNRYLQLLSDLLESPEPDADQLRLVCSLDTLQMDVRRGEETTRAVVSLPTHPLKLAWYLAHWDFMSTVIAQMLQMSSRERKHSIADELFERLQPYNLPAFVCDVSGNPYVSAGLLSFLHPVLVPAEVSDPDGVLGDVASMVGFDDITDQSSTLSASTVGERLHDFTALHPYLSTLRIQAVNPGRGALVADALRYYAKSQDEDEDSNSSVRKLDLVVHGTQSPQTPAPALTQLMSALQRDSAGRGSSHLSPAVQLARRPFGLEYIRDLPGHDVNISIATDVFSPLVSAISPAASPAYSSSAEGLLTRWITDFSLDGLECSWTRYVKIDEEGSGNTQRMLKAHGQHLQAVARLVGPEIPAGAVPAVTLHLGPAQRQLLDYLHDQSEWVLTVDRNIGVEYYDYPREPELSQASRKYIIDHVPEFTDGLGHRLIVTTSWYEEAAQVLRKALDSLELSSDEVSVDAVLRTVKAISGRLAMRVIGNEEQAKEVVGLAVVTAFLRSSGELDETVLIPVDPHARLLAAPAGGDTSSSRCDLLAVTLTSRTVRCRFIEVKFRTSEHRIPPEELIADMVRQMEHTRDRFMERYFPPDPRPDHALVRSELSGLLAYYLDRAWRHGWITDREEYDTMRGYIRRVETAYPQAAPSCLGFLVQPNVLKTRSVTVGEHEIKLLGAETIESQTEFRTRLGREAADAPEAIEPAIASPEAAEPGPAAPEAAELEVAEPEAAEPEVVEAEAALPVASGGQVEAAVEHEPGTEDEAPQLASARLDEARVAIAPPADGRPQEARSGPPSVSLGRLALDDTEVSWTPSLQGSPHVLLVGSTGSGKSTTVQHILGQLAGYQVPFLVLDFHGDLADSMERTAGTDMVQRLDATEGLPFSPLEPIALPGKGIPDPKTTSYEVAEVIGYVGGLGDMQRDLVYRALVNSYGLAQVDQEAAYPSMAELSRRIEEIEKEPGEPRNVLARCRQLLEFGLFADVTDGGAFQDMLKRPTAVVLGGLPIEQLQHAAVSFMLRRIYRQMFLWGEQEQLRLMVVLDEAHRVARDPTLPRLIKEGRKFGVGIIVASQEIRDFHDTVVTNAGTRIMFRTNYPESKSLAKFVQARATKNADFVRTLEALEVGRAFVQTQQMPHASECMMYSS